MSMSTFLHDFLCNGKFGKFVTEKNVSVSESTSVFRLISYGMLTFCSFLW